jgi:hypothetical protein
MVNLSSSYDNSDLPQRDWLPVSESHQTKGEPAGALQQLKNPAKTIGLRPDIASSAKSQIRPSTEFQVLPSGCP